MTPRKTDEQTFLETMAGVRCICGHLANRHRKPDPAFKVGALVALSGACRDCDCKGEVGLPPEGDDGDVG